MDGDCFMVDEEGYEMFEADDLIRCCHLHAVDGDAFIFFLLAVRGAPMISSGSFQGDIGRLSCPSTPHKGMSIFYRRIMRRYVRAEKDSSRWMDGEGC
jgi:hypothetical protein